MDISKFVVTLVLALATLVGDTLAQTPSSSAAGPSMCACPGRHKPLGNAPNCNVACFGGAGASGGMSSLQQQQLELAGQVGALLGTLLHEALFGNPQEQAQREAERRAQEEAWRLEQQRIAAEEERRKDEMKNRLLATMRGLESAPALTFKEMESSSASSNFKLDTSSRWSASSPDAPATSTGLQFKFGDSAPAQTITLAEIPASSAMAQLTRAAYFSEQALAARTPEEAKAFADAAFDGAIGAPADLPVPPSTRAVPVRDADMPGIENTRKQYWQSSDRLQQSVANVNNAEQQRELAERILKEAQARLTNAEKATARASAADRKAELDKARRIAEEAQALLEAQNRKLAEAYARAAAAEGLAVSSVDAILEVLDSVLKSGMTESSLEKNSYVRGVHDASRCIPANGQTYCAKWNLPNTQSCLANYARGYQAGEQIKERELREANQIGRQAKLKNNPLIAINHPKSVGPCQVQWTDAYHRGYDGIDDSAWMQFQREMIASRNQADSEKSRILREIDRLQIPLSPGFVRVHEGVVFGAATDAARARKFELEGDSIFQNKTYQMMNEEARARREIGTMVVSFGVPLTNVSNLDLEIIRVGGDHYTGGQISLLLPQNRAVVDALSGKEFDRLLAHSNGATVTEALIRRNIIKVHELNILGGDRSLNRAALQQLLDEGKVDRIVVWVNKNDLVPKITTADQGVVNPPQLKMVEHYVRRAGGALGGGGDSRVCYRYFSADAPAAAPGVLGPHDVELVYYPEIKKALRQATNPCS